MKRLIQTMALFLSLDYVAMYGLLAMVVLILLAVSGKIPLNIFVQIEALFSLGGSPNA